MDLDAVDTKITPPTVPIILPTNHTPKSLSFTNGTLKRHPTTTVTPPPQPPSMVVFSYKECLKNHAASIGGHALDGCGEFMPSSSTNPTDPRSLKCAACGCHRNFHRREPQEHKNNKLNNNNNTNNNLNNTNNNNNNNPTFLSCIYTTPSAAPPLSHRAMSQSTSQSLSSSPSHSPSPISSPSPPPLSHVPPSYHTSAPHMLLALGTAYNSALPSDEPHHHHKNLNFTSVVLKGHENNPKKRYRTKFSKEQKEKMHSFSEKLGWRMQKGDDGLVQEFCKEIGVTRGVFKVWMHNNKNTLRKRSEEGNAIANVTQTDVDHDDDDHGNGDGDGNGGSGGGGGFDSDINDPYNPNSSNNNNDIHMNEEDGCVNVHVSLNEMSS